MQGMELIQTIRFLKYRTRFPLLYEEKNAILAEKPRSTWSIRRN